MSADILVIEDNEDNMALVAYLLRAHGYQPRLASTGEEGVRMAIEQPPDLVLLDIRLPGMDGYGVIATLKAVPGLEHTPVVALTASAMAADATRISAAGFDGYIPKPIDPEAFLGQIERFLVAEPSSAGERR